jgi:hypothetical protein
MKKISTDMQNLIEISKNPREAAERCAELAKINVIKILNDINRVSDRNGNSMHIRIAKLRMEIEREGL